MADRSLLERLVSSEQTVNPLGRLNRSVLAHSILSNLSRLFNARRGSCLARPDYGLTDFNDTLLTGGDATTLIARAIKQQIDLFEPRLTQVMVRPVPTPDDPLAMRFNITGRIRLLDGERILFSTTLADDGRMKVSN